MADDNCTDPSRDKQLFEVRKLCLPELVLLMQRLLFRNQQWKEWYDNQEHIDNILTY